MCHYHEIRISADDSDGDWKLMKYFHIGGNVAIPTDELMFFRGLGLNHQPVADI